ncbi:hypothetical protein CEP52_004599 [Fusarium oligoseptatum]|uniref:Heterokaryon incompatibility domain-containing protein n=1 Tax=Fusarium oligoseptatum TaxID=2604345 RepID=A0A428U2X8_9HYPO|nr:hypothetical protein CEP52_004599 [Fusarium oligoseptatum]
MTDVQEKCDCRKPDVNIDETCGGCGNLVNFEHLRQRAVDTYDRDGQPIEDSNLPRRHLRIQNPSNSLRLLHLDDKNVSHSQWHVRKSFDHPSPSSEFIIIGGRLFPITKNCAAVLRKIREAKTKRVIWIDSLCINQNDVKERSVQVSQMGKIYSGAQKVHIYLGNNVDDETASEAFHVLNSVEDLDEFSMRLGGRAMSVKALFTQPYFSRMWIIQEVLLAKSAELHWGTATIPWRALSEGHLEQFKKAGIDGDIPEWIRIRAINKNFRNSETLGELLFSAMGSNASNDRDKVYGIYGLLFDAEEEGLTVDYGLSVKRVFTTMAVHLIRKHNTLQAVLRHANHDSPLIDGERLPSWVPDFRSRCVPKDLSISFDGSSELKIHSSTSSEDVIASFGENELYLRGHRLRIFQDGDESIQDRKIVQCKMRDIMWEIHANFPVTFKPKEHVVFWMSNGLFLHLKRHSARKDTYTFLGQCVLKHSDPFPTLVVRDRPRSFADAMFGLDFLTWKDLTSLWKLYTDF